MLGARLAPNGEVYSRHFDRNARNSFEINEPSSELARSYFKATDEKGFSLMPHAPESLITDDIKFTNEEGLNSINENNQPQQGDF